MAFTSFYLWFVVTTWMSAVKAFFPVTLPRSRLSSLTIHVPPSAAIIHRICSHSRPSPAIYPKALNRHRHIPKLLPLYMIFDKLFEEAGPLGKGITVGKVQVALSIQDRQSPSSLFKVLAKSTQNVGKSNQQLSRMAHEVCLTLLRNSDKWIGACSTSQWFRQSEGGKAESVFNELVNREAMKFEKEYIPDLGSVNEPSSSSSIASTTIGVVSIIVEIQGDSTEFKGAGYSLAGTKAVISSLASSVLVDNGYCLNAIEVLWTPSEMDEVLTPRDVILDFPEIINF